MVRMFISLLVVATLAFASASRAEPIRNFPVEISALIDPHVVNSALWDDSDREVVEKKLTDALSKHLINWFSYFRYNPPRKRYLQLHIGPGLGGSVVMTILGSADRRYRPIMRPIIWIKPGSDLSSHIARPKDAENELVNLLQVIFVYRNYFNSLERWLNKNVPIARDGYWINPNSNDDLRIALSLPMDEFDGLKNSKFSLVGKPSRSTPSVKVAAPGDIHALADETKTPYPPPPKAMEFMGIEAWAQALVRDKVEYKIDAGNHHKVHQLKLGPVFLFEYLSQTDFETDDQEDR